MHHGNTAPHRTDNGTDGETSGPLKINYACATDDQRFIRAVNKHERRIQWIYMATGCVEAHILEILEGNAQDVWLWVDGDELALRLLPNLNLDFTSPLRYTLAADSLRVRWKRLNTTTCFENQQLAKRRERVQSEVPVVRLAAIVWLVLTFNGLEELRSLSIDEEEESHLKNLIRFWWDILSSLWDALPLAPSISEYSQHSCFHHSCGLKADNNRKSFAAWFYVQSVLSPEKCVPQPWSLACHYDYSWLRDWIFQLKNSGVLGWDSRREDVLTSLGMSFRRNGDVRLLVTECAPYLDYTPHLLKTLNIILSKRDPRNNLIVVPPNILQLEGDSEKPGCGLLVVIMKADGGEVLDLKPHLPYAYVPIPGTIATVRRASINAPINAPVTSTESLRDVLESTDCDHVMQQISIPWVMAVMELLLFEIKSRVPNHKLCNRYLRRLSRTHGVLPPSFLIYNVEQDGRFAVKTGGYADVYKGRLNQEVVCLKVLRYFSSCTPANRRKLVKDFCREVLVWKQLDHPNILPFIGVSADLFHPSLCLISPWMHNGNINEFLEKHPGHDCHKTIAEIAQAIKYLHSHDPPIVHADIRGANVLVTHDLRCCLADFGLAVIAESQPFTSTSRRSQGTLRWMAPEYFQDNAPQTPQPPRDIYAFACTVLEIFTGKPPFHYLKHDGAIINQVSNGTRPRRDDFPFDRDRYLDELWSLLESCWYQDPARRPIASDILDNLVEVSN